ncbi:AAA family ATPase [Xanthomonas nasturtii]|uniref:AAA family ATPase n=1 Tax=Xanthomonas nasturtii TaxID=1843581 RepID=UPI002012D8A8|nr:AAA family ATPase [Xanthomonas nasturtii]MCL1498826.1 AAA family ATPase [Xanthomonas nasturtii]MCL1502625.1 AAA family ATPase [Xanthomonas nasturtii]
MFDEIEIEGLKGVGSVRLAFDPASRVRVLFGSNGVGKTKCLEAIYEALLLTNSEFLDGGHFVSQADWPVMKSFCADGKRRFSVLEIADEIMLSSVLKKLPEQVLHNRPVVYLGAARRSSLPENNNRGPVLGRFADRRSAHFSRIFADIKSGALASSGMTEDVRAWFVARAQSVNPYQKNSDNLQSQIDAVLGLLNYIDNRISSSGLAVDAAEEVFLEVEGSLRELGELSSGFISLLKMIQSIISGYACFSNDDNLSRLPGIVLIDEIESHLHVSWQTTIISKLKEMLPNTAFFIATHSPLVLAQLEEGEGYLLQRDQNEVVRSRTIDSPNMKAFADVLEETFGVDLNALKRDALVNEDQSATKRALLDLIKQRRDRQDGKQA